MLQESYPMTWASATDSGRASAGRRRDGIRGPGRWVFWVNREPKLPHRRATPHEEHRHHRHLEQPDEAERVRTAVVGAGDVRLDSGRRAEDAARGKLKDLAGGAVGAALSRSMDGNARGHRAQGAARRERVDLIQKEGWFDQYWLR